MSVKLDWQIEAEHAHQRVGEDPADRRNRRRRQIAIVLATGMAVLFLGGIIAAVLLRLSAVDSTLKQGLENAAHAEVSALKLGDLPGFMGLMRGGNNNWLPEQSTRFARYQDLKQKGAIRLTDNILESTVDGQRGRVVIEEILNGQTTRAAWFFWRYQDGWRHVPSDLTFWGDPDTITGKATTVTYNTLDRNLAQDVAGHVDKWWSEGCIYLGCDKLPRLTVEISALAPLQPQWDSQNDLLLRMGSPLAVNERAVVDPALAAAQEEAIASRLAERLFDQASGKLRTNPNSDAAWLRRGIIEWLTAAMLGRGDPAQLSFVQSVKDNYGPAGMVSVVHSLTPNADVSILSKALGQSLDTLNVDWRTFFQGRLALEKVLIASGDQVSFFALWDPTPDALTRARQRLSRPDLALLEVKQVALARDSTNVPVATVQAHSGEQNYILQFRLINGNWRRFS